MNISSALRKKNQLVTEINDLYTIVMNNNSIAVDSTSRFTIAVILKDIDEKTNQLVDLKSKIHAANLPVFNKIFELSELKNSIKRLKLVSTEEGTSTGRGYSSTSIVKKAQIPADTMLNIIKTMQAKIETLQSELDEFNVSTEI